MARIVSVKFCNAGRHYHFRADDLDLSAGDTVVVETARGRALASVVTPPQDVPDDELPKDIKAVLRKATTEDLLQETIHKNREKEAFEFCRKCIQERGMVMKLVRAEYLFDGSKIIFYFTADGRVDFRELVKDLAHRFHTRIEMKQIGVRDEAKLVGGLGICGRELCCRTFLREFSPVSVKMAKEQGLALNPSKISGQCGRLLCCLSYEFDTYCQLKKNLPKTGERVTINGRQAVVTDLNVITQEITLRTEDEKILKVSPEELREGRTKTVLLDLPGPPPEKEEKAETPPPEKKRPPSDQPARSTGQGKKSRKKSSGRKASPKPTQSPQKMVRKPEPKQDRPAGGEGDGTSRRKRSRPRKKTRKKTDDNNGKNDTRRET